MTERDYLFARLSPEMKAYTETGQFKLSERILDLRYEKGLSFEEAVAITGLKPESYLGIEYASEEIPLVLYFYTIFILEEYK